MISCYVQVRLLKPAKYVVTINMQSVRPFITYLQISRRVSTSSIRLDNFREGRFMKRILQESRKSKKKWHEPSAELRSAASFNVASKSPSAHVTRRMIIRDKLFMQHITNMMSTELVADIMKGDIEITRVKITQDFKYVNVFYIISNNNSLVDPEALHKCAGIIRHELSQLRVIGIVPPVQFVEDRQHLKQREVEKRLAMINLEKEVLSEQLDISDVSDVDQTLDEELFANHVSETNEFYNQLPLMRHDVLGLDHHKIMSQITSAVSKTKKAAERRMLNANSSIDENYSNPVSTKVAEFITREDQQKIFSDFLRKKQREERFKHKMKNDKQNLLNSFEKEMDNEEPDYEDNVDMDVYDNDIDDEDTDDFEDETRK